MKKGCEPDEQDEAEEIDDNSRNNIAEYIHD